MNVIVAHNNWFWIISNDGRGLVILYSPMVNSWVAFVHSLFEGEHKPIGFDLNQRQEVLLNSQINSKFIKDVCESNLLY